MEMNPKPFETETWSTEYPYSNNRNRKTLENQNLGEPKSYWTKTPEKIGKPLKPQTQCRGFPKMNLRELKPKFYGTQSQILVKPDLIHMYVFFI